LFIIDGVPRTKKISDGDVLDLVAAHASLHGPAAVTFQSAGLAAGLSPATLVQRYGSKSNLVRAALLRLWDTLDLATAQEDARHKGNGAGALSMLLALSSDLGAGPQQTAQGVLLLREDFRDAALRARGAAWTHGLAQMLGRRLGGSPATQKRLGRMMVAQWQGAVLAWCFCREGALQSYLRRELGAWLRAVGCA
jgi:AcrR family transcriptional regulator